MILIDKGIGTCYNGEWNNMNGEIKMCDDLIDSVTQGDKLRVALCLHQGQDPNIMLKNTPTPLVCFAMIAQPHLVELLIDYGADIDATYADGSNLLMRAVMDGHTDLVRYLIDRNINLGHVDDEGYTALTHAVCKPNFDIFSMVLENTKDVNVRTRLGLTALVLAAKHNHPNMVKALLDHGANRFIASDSGIDARQCALLFGYREIANMLENYMPKGRFVNGKVLVKSRSK